MIKHHEYLSPRHAKGLTSSKKSFKTNNMSYSMAADDKMFKTISSKCGEEDVVFVSVKKTKAPKISHPSEKITGNGPNNLNKASRNLTVY
jgi:hypothetical protein